MLYNSSKHGAICGVFFLELRLSSNISLKCRVGVLNNTIQWAIPEKIQTRGELRIYFFENYPGIFHFFTLPLEIPDKTKLSPWIFHKIVLEPLEIPRPKTKTPGNSTLFFLGHPWKFHFIFN